MQHYGTVAGATAYHDLVGNTAWAAATEQLQLQALRRASRALDGIFGARLTGSKISYLQELAWPRHSVYDSCAGVALPDGYTPPAIEEAAYILAGLELANPNSLAPVVNLSRVTKSEAVEGVGSRSFFGPADLGMTSFIEASRGSVLQVEDLMGCFLKRMGDRWVARVV